MYSRISRLFSRINCLRYRISGICIGPSRISMDSTISKYGGGSITISSGCNIHKGVILVTYGGKISLGYNVSLNPYTVIYGHGGVKIGNNTRIAANCTLISANHNFDDPNIPITLQGESRQGIVIGDDVWIGTGVRILDGVTIGNGSIVGAGAVVTRDILPMTIVAGVPAKAFKKRY